MFSTLPEIDFIRLRAVGLAWDSAVSVGCTERELYRIIGHRLVPLLEIAKLLREIGSDDAADDSVEAFLRAIERDLRKAAGEAKDASLGRIKGRLTGLLANSHSSQPLLVPRVKRLQAVPLVEEQERSEDFSALSASSHAALAALGREAEQAISSLLPEDVSFLKAAVLEPANRLARVVGQGNALPDGADQVIEAARRAFASAVERSSAAKAAAATAAAEDILKVMRRRLAEDNVVPPPVSPVPDHPRLVSPHTGGLP
jgi:hypothetical protein